MPILLGAIADDFTGATDLCNTLAKSGLRTVQVIGVPGSDTDPGDAEAVVVALKSRTAPAEEAVAQSLAAYDWLIAQGARQVVEKYCSTFDSTAQGNIGPITDALLARSGASSAVICPAFPDNARTVYQGHLFVGGELLSDSSMKDHPLTPMRDASLPRLIEAQGKGRAGVVPLPIVRQGAEALREAMERLSREGRAYIVVDAVENADLLTLGAAVRDHPLVTGGSGVALGLAGNFREAGLTSGGTVSGWPAAQGRKLVLAGSCSSATREQIERVRALWPSRKIDVDAIADGSDVVADLADWAVSQPADMPVLIYSSADPDELRDVQARHGRDTAGELIERTQGGLAGRLVAAGFGTLVVAGGETSGAVVSALGITALRIFGEIAPGVPWTQSVTTPQVTLALKSGNFGSSAFFEEAFARLA